MISSQTLERFVTLKLGSSDTNIELQSRAESQHATDLMVSQAGSTLDIFSRDLDPMLYDRQSFLDLVSNLCAKNRKARIRVLVQDPMPAVKNAHRFIELSRKLSSSIEIRQPHPDYRQYNEAFLVADGCGLIHRTLADRHEGNVNFYDPIAARRLLDFFTEVWERSEVNPELRRLHL